MRPDISWESFIINNPDARGIHYKFEDLCRQLFCCEQLSNNKKIRYIHCNPNNPGLEAEPILDENNKRRIGFQVKYFENNVSYSQIKGSVERIIEKYKGKVDCVFLYCNKPLNKQSLEKTKQLLEKSGIKLELITDNAILDLVRRYDYLGIYYFGCHSININWFKDHAKIMFDELGERYNRQFNIETTISKDLSLFIHETKEIEAFNQKKKEALKSVLDFEIDGCYKENEIFKSLKHTCFKLQRIKPISNIEKWNQILAPTVRECTSHILKIKEELNKEYEAMYKQSRDNKRTPQECTQAEYNCYQLDKRIQNVDTFHKQANILLISDREKSLLDRKVLVISGEPGTGKTQLLARMTERLLNDEKEALLLVAGMYYTKDPIVSQIINNLHLNYCMNDLIDILDAIGEKENRIVPIFIDALNETWMYQLWKTGLFEITEKVNKSSHVKLILSCRSDYLKCVLPDSLFSMIKKGEILSLEQTGFDENAFSAAEEFLKKYNIAFSPLEYFGYEISNPLFLTLYCKTYSKNEVCLRELFDRLVDFVGTRIYKTFEESMKNSGLTENDSILKPFVKELIPIMYRNEKRMISRAELCRMTFWSYYHFPPMGFVKQLVKENLLHCFCDEDSEEEFYYFAYDQMNDYYFAQYIVNSFSDERGVYEYIRDELLKIENGTMERPWNVNVFINVCALFVERFDRECIDIINELESQSAKEYVLSLYITSFQWRKAKYIPKDRISYFLDKRMCLPNVWDTLIVNSLKVFNPINADFLHKTLLPLPLNIRDSIWTTYINSFSFAEPNRIVQLIKVYDRGDKLQAKNNKQIELLLTLFGWLLTSSNRSLRDYTSKAMIEILKEHFIFCQIILEKFSSINDPYVIQRLYGIVFGACCKRLTQEEMIFCKLAKYIYKSIFSQKQVYPDILLRDYARMTLELFLSEYPKYEGTIERKTIMPPYKSNKIPRIRNYHYLERKTKKGDFAIINSMRLEKMMSYGDFGRYVFQRAISHFDVNLDIIFNYTLYFIFNKLHYSERLLGEYDMNCLTHDRYSRIKTERIGKKYQWIAFYNILARISDHNKTIDSILHPIKSNAVFEGAWEPYVRDFDPTLNTSFMTCTDAPVFAYLEKFLINTQKENIAAGDKDEKAQTDWLNAFGYFHQNLKKTLCLYDNKGTEWIVLGAFLHAHHDKANKFEFRVWSDVYAFFVSSKQKQAFKKCSSNKLNVVVQEFVSPHQTYSVFNREYPWSPSCKRFNKDAWIDVFLETGKVTSVSKPMPNMTLFATQDSKNGFSFDFNPTSMSQSIMIKEPETVYIGKILHATSTLLWEEEYDATKEYPISRDAPCAEMIETLNLKQIRFDGFFYDSNRCLAAFDLRLTQEHDCFVVRKDLLDSFLKKTDLKLIWLVNCQKELYITNSPPSQLNKWQAVFYYESNVVKGELYKPRTMSGF